MQRKPTSKEPRAEHTDDDSSGNGSLSRRKMMAAGAATWVTASFAGCSGDGGETTTAETTTAGEPQPANYVVTDEMATAAAFGVSFASSCSPTRLFAPGMKAIWEINVYDAESGENLGPDAVDSVTVNVDGAGELEAAWMGDEEEHPADMWEATWDVPSDAETGEWTYTIEVTATNEADVLSVGRATGSFTVQADEMPDFYVSTETYWNGHPAPEGTAGFVGTCAPEREFFTTMDPTFYVQIYETESGLIVGKENEKNSEVDAVSDYTIDSVTVRFPETDEFDNLSMEWVPGTGENDKPHFTATLTSPEELPVGTHPYEIDIVGNEGDINEEDVLIVGAASDAFNVIEK
jgi:hypothetical protein